MTLLPMSSLKLLTARGYMQAAAAAAFKSQADMELRLTHEHQRVASHLNDLQTQTLKRQLADLRRFHQVRPHGCFCARQLANSCRLNSRTWPGWPLLSRHVLLYLAEEAFCRLRL